MPQMLSSRAPRRNCLGTAGVSPAPLPDAGRMPAVPGLSALLRYRRGAGGAEADALALALPGFGDLEGQLEGLAGVEPRVAMGVVAVRQRGFADRLGAADAFGDVLPSQFEMHPAGIAALGEMDGEGAVQLVEDAVEDARLVTGRRGDRVAVHRVDAPHDLGARAPHCPDHR